MKTEPLISVLVPAFNHAAFVEQTLDSILADDYPRKEIVIIDDGSGDNTATKIQQWIERNGDAVSVDFHSRPNRGITATLNELVRRSKGDYVTVIASDDYLLSGGLQKRLKFLESRPHLKAAFADCIVVDGQGRQMHSSGLFQLYRADVDALSSETQLHHEMLRNWSVPGGTLMVKREVYDRFTYDENLVIEDLDFFLKLMSLNWLGFLNTPVSAYRIHGGNTCLHGDYWIRVAEDLRLSIRQNLHRLSTKEKLLVAQTYWRISRPLWRYRLKKLVT